MSNQYTFRCKFCGMEFNDDVIALALHIGRIHDTTREKELWTKKEFTELDN